MKQARYFLEAALLKILMLIFKIMPLDAASGAGGWIGRTIGPRLSASRTALRNLEAAMPELDETARKNIVTDMWDNLGRMIAEYPHLEKIAAERVAHHCEEKAAGILEEDKPFIMIAGHTGNWEVFPAAFTAEYGRPFDLTYRAPNNPWVDRLLVKMRSVGGTVGTHPKSRKGGYDMTRALRSGKPLAVLFDQKYNEGMPAPFFGRPAMTNPIFVQLALKFGCPLVPVYLERTEGVHFKITIYDPMVIKSKSNEVILAEANALLESWVRKKPAQWLWLHRRWDSRNLEKIKEAA